jgi:hypothetical protein
MRQWYSGGPATLASVICRCASNCGFLYSLVESGGCVYYGRSEIVNFGTNCACLHQSCCSGRNYYWGPFCIDNTGNPCASCFRRNGISLSGQDMIINYARAAGGSSFGTPYTSSLGGEGTCRVAWRQACPPDSCQSVHLYAYNDINDRLHVIYGQFASSNQMNVFEAVFCGNCIRQLCNLCLLRWCTLCTGFCIAPFGQLYTNAAWDYDRVNDVLRGGFYDNVFINTALFAICGSCTGAGTFISCASGGLCGMSLTKINCTPCYLPCCENPTVSGTFAANLEVVCSNLCRNSPGCNPYRFDACGPIVLGNQFATSFSTWNKCDQAQLYPVVGLPGPICSVI